MRALLFCGLALSALGVASSSEAQSHYIQPSRGQSNLQPVYRFFNPYHGDQLFTLQPRREAPELFHEYIAEGVAFYLPDRDEPGLVQFNRFIIPNSGGHFYSPSLRDGLKLGAHLEGPLGYISVSPRRDMVALHEWYQPALDRFFYTTDPRGEFAGHEGYNYLGVVGYVIPNQRNRF